MRVRQLFGVGKWQVFRQDVLHLLGWAVLSAAGCMGHINDPNAHQAAAVSGGSSGENTSAMVDPAVSRDPMAPAATFADPALALKGLIYHEDFESYPAKSYQSNESLGQHWLVDVRNQTNLAIETAKAFSGAQAMHVTAPAGSDRFGMLRIKAPLLPAQNNMFYGRMMMWMTKLPSTPTNSCVHFNLADAYGKLTRNGITTDEHYDFGGHCGHLQAFYSAPNDCWAANNDVNYPEKQWVCVNWQFDGSPDGAGGTKDTIEVWLDRRMKNTTTPPSLDTGVETASDLKMSGIGSGCSDGATVHWYAPVFSEVYVGYLHAQPSVDPIDVWIDDIAFASEPIPCPIQ